jgi:hypothetical protein
MIQHVWSVACQSASFDTQTNRVSLLNTLENVLVLGTLTREKPLLLSCEIVSVWAREKDNAPCSGQMRAIFLSPEGGSPPPISLEIDLTKTPFHRTRISLASLPVVSTGRFEFLIEYQNSGQTEWQPAAHLPFLVISQSPIEVKPEAEV